MKTITIGDIHGSNKWKAIRIVTFDKVIFVGDYVDDWPPVTDEQIMSNLLEIINLKKEHPDKIVLLVGNHDARYMFLNKMNNLHLCTGFRQSMAYALSDVFEENGKLFQMAYGHVHDGEEYLWTHAGIVDDWYVNRFQYNLPENIREMPLHEKLNLMFDRYYKPLFDVGHMRGGDYRSGGPLWADRLELLYDPLPNLHQIVGHSKVRDIETYTKEGNVSLTFVDVLHKKQAEFYELEL